MEQNKYYHFETKANFNSQKLSANSDNTLYTVGADTDICIAGTPDISYDSICYIKETAQIWTHGKLYYKDVEERLTALENKERGHRTYSSYAELGFASAPKTSEFFAAMENNTSAVISYYQVSDPPISNFKGVIVIYKVYNNTLNYSDGRIFAYYDKGKDPFNEYDGNFPYIGDYYMRVYNGVALGTWLCCNDFISASSWVDAFSHSAIKTQISSFPTSYIPLIGFASSKSMGNAYGDYNVSIGTQPSGDTADTDTRLFINWDNGGTDATRGDFRKDITTTFRTRGLDQNKILVSNGNGVVTTSTYHSNALSMLSEIPLLSNKGTSKIGYYKYGKMVLISINGATSSEITSYNLPFTPFAGTTIFESTVNGIASGTTYAVEIWIDKDNHILRMGSSPASTSQKYYGQIVYFTN